MTEAICTYWTLNGNSTGSGVMWDAFKAWVRGEYISRISVVQREAAKSLQNLEAEAERREREYVGSPTETTYYA